MNVVKSRSSKFISSLPTRLYYAFPAVILGTLFNILDTVSIGILVFPPTDGAFQAVQLQGLSMFIMSTLASQVVMTLGGSRFPGAMGAMLMEIMPFLRGIAGDIRNALGDGHPGLIPTVMAAYALTSLLTGLAFVVLGLLRLGAVVAYFPHTVLTGAIGAIGVSLFVLGLGLPFPSSATPLALDNAASILFDRSHLGILAASFFPAFILSVSLRSKILQVWTRGFVSSAFYIPIYLLCIPAIFWIVVSASHIRMDNLVANGWLFTVDPKSPSTSEIVASWNYWSLFNFNLVEWKAMKSAVQNIVLLVVIGVLNLPIFVPSLAFTLDVAYDMNHELFGQGLANILAGVLGSLPNILQYSYSVYVTRARGGRFELWIVIIFTFALFLSAGALLPYVPTILASAMVLFLGIELFLGAAWEASESLTPIEYAVVIGTLAACTFIGFAEGFGVGIGAATVVYLVYGVIDSPARTKRLNEWKQSEDADDTLDLKSSNAEPLAPSLVDEYSTIDTVSRTAGERPLSQDIDAHVVLLSGYIFFASVPSMEKNLLHSGSSLVILDLTGAHRMETTAGRCITRCVRELKLKQSRLVICGVRKNSGLHADLLRAEVPLLFDARRLPGADGDQETPLGYGLGDSGANEDKIVVFETRAACMTWYQKHSRRAQTNQADMDVEAMNDAYRQFRRLFNFDADAVLGKSTDGYLEDKEGPSDLERFITNGGQITTYLPGQLIPPYLTFVLDGQINVQDRASLNDEYDTPVARPSFRSFLTRIPRDTIHILQAHYRSLSSRFPALLKVHSLWRRNHMESLDLRVGERVGVAVTKTVVVQVQGEQLVSWAQSELNLFVPTQTV